MKPSAGGDAPAESSSESTPLAVSTMEFEALYRLHGPAVYRYAFSVTRRRELAEDLTSEAFLALHREMARIDPGQLPAWLITVVRNRARDHWRRRVVEERYIEQEVRSAEPSVDAPPLEGWILQCADLKPVHRTCLMLRFVAGMSRTEIAAATGLSETQVKGHLQYALTLLRKAHGVRHP
jgi:RNA polymerase sigma-70 factor, ECF subfamily